MSAEGLNKTTPITAFGRYWWVFLFMAFVLAYFFVVSFLVVAGKAQRVDGPVSGLFEAVVTIAPWHAEGLIAYAEYKRSYATSGEANNSNAVLQDSLRLIEEAIQVRPLWPYYHLGALDAEYLLGRPDEVIQARLDTIINLAPNERGLDFNLIELSLLSWHNLRSDQQRWIAARIQTARRDTRKELSGFIEQMIKTDPAFCSTLPWQTVRKFCLPSPE